MLGWRDGLNWYAHTRSGGESCIVGALLQHCRTFMYALCTDLNLVDILAPSTFATSSAVTSGTGYTRGCICRSSSAAPTVAGRFIKYLQTQSVNHACVHAGEPSKCPHLARLTNCAWRMPPASPKGPYSSARLAVCSRLIFKPYLPAVVCSSGCEIVPVDTPGSRTHMRGR